MRFFHYSYRIVSVAEHKFGDGEIEAELSLPGTLQELKELKKQIRTAVVKEFNYRYSTDQVKVTSLNEF